MSIGDRGMEVDAALRPVPSGEQEEGKYVYAIIESDVPRGFGSIGIGGRGDLVHTILHAGLAAVVSDTPVVVYDPTRANVLVHENVTETVMKEFTVIPMSFGTVFRTEDDVIEFLKHTSDTLHDVLHKMMGKIEFGLKVNWDPDAVIKSVEQERDDIRQLKEGIASNRLTSTYFARMQLGQLVERAMSQKAEEFVKEIYEGLRPCAIASRHNNPIGEKMILNAAFLVDRNQSEQFHQEVGRIAQKYDKELRFVPTGPWPPYNFVNIRLKLERPSGAS